MNVRKDGLCVTARLEGSWFFSARKRERFGSVARDRPAAKRVLHDLQVNGVVKLRRERKKPRDAANNVRWCIMRGQSKREEHVPAAGGNIR